MIRAKRLIEATLAELSQADIVAAEAAEAYSPDGRRMVASVEAREVESQRTAEQRRPGTGRNPGGRGDSVARVGSE
jgi:hypothetical protein